VTQIFQSGNAATKARGGGVEIGDQLAAINGTNTVNMKVGAVRDLISDSPNPKEIELTFLRYVGPLRPKSATPTNVQKISEEITQKSLPEVTFQKATGDTNKTLKLLPANQNNPTQDEKEQITKKMDQNTQIQAKQHSPKKKPEWLETWEQKVDENASPQSQAPVKSKTKKRFKMFGRSKKNG